MTKDGWKDTQVARMRTLLRRIVRLLSRFRGLIVIARLKAMGCHVDWTAEIHPSAAIEPSGGSISIGAKSSVDRGVVLRAMGGSISIGSHCSVNGYSFLSGTGGIQIANNVMIGSHVTIYASNHVFSDLTVPMDQQGLSAKGITIERDVWVGTGVRILDGVRVSQGSVLAAGAVVTRSTVPHSINAGVPARLIGSRLG